MFSKLILGDSRFLFLKPDLADSFPQRLYFLLRRHARLLNFAQFTRNLFKRIARHSPGVAHADHAARAFPAGGNVS